MNAPSVGGERLTFPEYDDFFLCPPSAMRCKFWLSCRMRRTNCVNQGVVKIKLCECATSPSDCLACFVRYPGSCRQIEYSKYGILSSAVGRSEKSESQDC